ncbi:hypothetical protein LshimejAT787_1800850 [Lyophyllum shimeji]|uniref:Uncharacterized protein n=1 Tax=Lyophyllum shimeji TaxID=47721 RepID=A0A9P3Q065_LYOSH|nr:hypothetical protein LshimejAT787_1800850 [Lyophyllum shimeji]
MRVPAIFVVTVVLHALFVLAAPVSESQDRGLLSPRLFGSSSKVKGKTGTSGTSRTTGSSGGLFGGLFGGNKKTSTAPPARTTAPVPQKTSGGFFGGLFGGSGKTSTAAPQRTTAPVSPKTSPAAPSSTVSRTPSSSISATPSSTAASASDSAAFCPLYLAADAADISARDIEEYEKRAGEELWFRFEDPSVATAGKNFLQLAARSSGKNFDDQAYKWISTDVSKVTRGNIPKRVPTLYVLPAGTRASILGAAQDFETTSTAKQRADFVTKDNEPGDVGIQGVTPDASGVLPLDAFRSKVIRVVVKSTSNKAGGKATFTTIGADGKASKTASKSDQAALSKFC